MQLKPPSPTEALIVKYHQISYDDSLALRHLNLIKYESIKICPTDRLDFLRNSINWRIGQIYQKLSNSTPGIPIPIPPETAIEIDCANIIASECIPTEILFRIEKIRDCAIPCFKASLTRQTPEQCIELRSQLKLLLQTQLQTIYYKKLEHSNRHESDAYLVLLDSLIKDVITSIQ